MERKALLRSLLRPEKLIWVLLLLLLAERLLLFRQFPVSYSSGSDDIAYMEGGLWFAKTGMISIWGHYPTAMIMPGMPVLIGCFSLLFGEGELLMLALKLLWILMGVATAYAAYKTVALVSNGWGGLAAACGFLVPNMAWMNHVILTETPYMLFLTLCIYYTLQMERSDRRRWFVGYVLSFLAALMFRSNIMLMLPLTAAWLLLRRKSGRLLLRRGLMLLCALLLFVLPWGLRNYLRFDAVIPLSYGAGNPLLLGTYQGEGYPADEELDYETNVHAVMRERYAAYYKDQAEPWAPEELDYYKEHFDPEGEIRELRYAQYLSLTQDGVKARYRMREWFQRDPAGMRKSYLLIKPRWMLNWAWAWEAAFHVPYTVLHRISQLNFLLCVLTVALSLLLRRCRAPVLFLSAVYWISVYVHSLAFVTDRYASTLVGLRYMIAGIGFALLREAIRRLRHRRAA